MTNQTIDGVPLLPCPFCGGEPYGTHDHYVHDDLSPMPCVECRSCSAHLKAGDWNRRVKPAAQPQGEPVAWQYRVSAGPQTGWSLWHDGKGEEFKRSYQVETRPLYAEQPAPVAVEKLSIHSTNDGLDAYRGKASD